MHHQHRFSMGAGLMLWFSQAVRASRGPVATPFLLYTKTITRGHAKISDERVRLGEDDAPGTEFQSSSTYQRRDIPNEVSELRSTITNSEREIFTKLFKLAAKDTSVSSTENYSKGQPAVASQSDHSGGQDSFLGGATPSASLQHVDPSLFPKSLRGLAESAQARGRQNEWTSMAQRFALARERNQAQEQQLAENPLQAKREERYRELDSKIQASSTDLELWEVLDDHVFSAIAALKLDEEPKTDLPTTMEGDVPSTYVSDVPATSSSHHNRKSDYMHSGKDRSTEELAILGPIYPNLVLSAMQKFRRHFSSSALALARLPRIKEVGRASYALGASTALYNEQIKLLTELNDFIGIDTLLAEMDNGGINFDEATLILLKEIASRRQRVLRGKAQGILQQVWMMESQTHDFALMKRWQGIIKRRFREQDEQDALLKAATLEQLVSLT